LSANAALTVWLELRVTWHPADVPPHPSPQPVSLAPEDGLAVSDTVVPGANAFEHVPGHEIPSPVMRPAPLTETVRVSNPSLVTDGAAPSAVRFPPGIDISLVANTLVPSDDGADAPGPPAPVDP
jgi:hypothetical protein